MIFWRSGMKNKTLILSALLVLSGCQSAHEENLYDADENLPFEEVKISDTAGSLQELAEEADSFIFSGDDQMHWWKLEDELLENMRADTPGTLGKALQISVLGHTFYEEYDDSRLAEEYIGIRFAGMKEYGTVSAEKQEAEETVFFQLAQDVSEEDGDGYTYMSLPVHRSVSGGYLLCENSEQLVYAAEYGYIPAAIRGSSAEEILKKCISILSNLKEFSGSETELYSAIYRYVLQSVHYDYTTLRYSAAQNRENRVFFLEGATEDGWAVCDGMCKEILLLSRLAGIEAHHIGARSGDSGHAYLYVKCDGSWYLSCPTYASKTVSLPDGRRLDYHTMNYMLTDLDTNEPGWEYVSDAYPEIREQIKAVTPYDPWRKEQIIIGETVYTLHPENADEAVTLLKEAARLQKKCGKAVEAELCGKASVLREAYEQLKKEGIDVMFYSGGTFQGERLQVYVIGGNS